MMMSRMQGLFISKNQGKKARGNKKHNSTYASFPDIWYTSLPSKPHHFLETKLRQKITAADQNI
jgi:hypothetical protein